MATESVKNVFISWKELWHKNTNGDVWHMLLFAILWTLWLFRNDIVFNNKILDEIQVFDLVKTCMAWWCKAKWPSTLFLFSDFYIAASDLSFNVQPKSPKTITF